MIRVPPNEDISDHSIDFGSNQTTGGKNKATSDISEGAVNVIMVAVATVLFIILCVTPVCQYIIGLHDRNVARERSRYKKKYLKQRVEKSLVINKVLMHGLSCEMSAPADGEKTLLHSKYSIDSSCKGVTPPKETKGISNNESIVIIRTIRDDYRTCSICLEPYKVGEKVAWTKQEGCDHVFHSECISPWLLCNEHCPCCRKQYLLDFKDGRRRQNHRILGRLMTPTRSLRTHPDTQEKKKDSYETIISRYKFCADHGLFLSSDKDDSRQKEKKASERNQTLTVMPSDIGRGSVDGPEQNCTIEVNEITFDNTAPP